MRVGAEVFERTFPDLGVPEAISAIVPKAEAKATIGIET
jgi:hypothetical protein